MRKNIKYVASLLSAVLILPLTAACGHVGQDAEASGNNDSDAKTIVIGENTKTNKPANYINEDGDIDGYEAQVLRKVDDLLPQYKFEYKSLDWPNLLVSLDTGKIDVAASTLQLNKERKAKYEYTRQGVGSYVARLAVPESDNTVHKISDLAGKTVYAWNGEATADILEQYNKANPDKQINLKYGDWTIEQAHAAVSSGEAAAVPYTETGIASDNKQYKTKFKPVGEVLDQQNTQFLLGKQDTQLRKDIDGAIAKLRKNGTLKKLSEKYYGGDFSEPVKPKRLSF